MPNVIKYTTGATETGCLRKGNMQIGNNTADYGLTFWNGINPPNGGYTIYLNKASGGPSIYCPANDTQLIAITNQIAGANYTTAAQCLDYFASQTDKLCVNINYEGIVTNGLMVNVDAGFRPSYPTTGNTIYDLSGNSRNGTLQNGPTFNSTYGGGIVLDGVDDSYSITGVDVGTSAFTLDCWFKYQTHNLYLPSICFAGDYWSGDGQTGWGFAQNSSQRSYIFGMTQTGNGGGIGVDLTSMVDGGIYNFVGTRTISGSQQILKGYVNGSLVGAVTGNTIFNLSTSAYFPGYNPTILRPKAYSYTGPPPATLYNIKVYNRDLSATEIAQNYNAQKGRFGL